MCKICTMVECVTTGCVLGGEETMIGITETMRCEDWSPIRHVPVSTYTLQLLQSDEASQMAAQMDSNDRTSDHYRATAEVYNQCYSQTHEAMVKIVQRKISLDEDDIVVDIGGGTGNLTHAIYKEAGLKRNVLCVEPSESMLRLACQKEGVSPLRGTAEEFFRNKENYTFTKALLLCCIHHFPETTPIFKKWAQWLPPGSLCFILTRPPKTTLPFFSKVFPLFEKSCADIPAMVECLRLLGLTVEVSEERMLLNMSKHRWYAMLRARYMSNMYALTDQDIEEGIVELERERFFDKQDITVEDNITAIIVRKDL